MRPNQRARLSAKLAQIAGTSYALRPDGADILSRSEFSTKFGVETGKMNTATRRNRFYTKLCSERMKRHPFCQQEKSVRPDAFAFYAVPASIDGISINDSGDYGFLQRYIGFIAQTAYGFFPNVAVVDNRFSGIGAHPSLLTIQSVRIGLKIPIRIMLFFCIFKILAKRNAALQFSDTGTRRKTK